MRLLLWRLYKNCWCTFTACSKYWWTGIKLAFSMFKSGCFLQWEVMSQHLEPYRRPGVWLLQSPMDCRPLVSSQYLMAGEALSLPQLVIPKAQFYTFLYHCAPNLGENMCLGFCSNFLLISSNCGHQGSGYQQFKMFAGLSLCLICEIFHCVSSTEEQVAEYSKSYGKFRSPPTFGKILKYCYT